MTLPVPENLKNVIDMTESIDKNKLRFLADWIGLIGIVYSEDELKSFFSDSLQGLDFFNGSMEQLEEARQQMIADDNFALGDFYQEVARRQMQSDYDFASTMFYDLPQGSVTLNKVIRDPAYFQSAPTDRFRISREDVDKLAILWDKDEKYQHVPSDILFDNGVVYDDIEIDVSGLQDDGSSVVHSMRVMLFTPYRGVIGGVKTLLEESNEFDSKIFYSGLMDIRLLDDDSKGFVFQFGFIPRCDYMIMGSRPCTYGLSDDELYDLGGMTTTGPWISLCSKYLRTWYSLNLLFSLPEFSEIFSPKSRVKDRRKRVSGVKMVQMSRKEREWDLTSEQIDRILAIPHEDFKVGYWEPVNEGYVYHVSDWFREEVSDGETSEEEKTDTDIGTTAEDAGGSGAKEEASGTSGTGT